MKKKNIFRPAFSLIIPSILCIVFYSDILILFFASSAFITYVFYILLFHFLVRIKFGKISNAQVKSIPRLSVDEPGNILISEINLPENLPGFVYMVRYKLIDEFGKFVVKTNPLFYFEKNTYMFSVLFDTHGIFTLANIEIIYTDLLKTTAIPYQVDITIECTVEPFPLSSVRTPTSAQEGGHQPIASLLSLDSDDFFELRNYYPGDDIRKVNWKIYAHTGELYIRKQEKTPPDTGIISIYYAPYSPNSFESEYITSLFYETALGIIGSGLTLKVYYPSCSDPVQIDKESHNNLESLIYKPNSYFINSNTKNIAENSIMVAFVTKEYLSETANYILKNGIIYSAYENILNDNILKYIFYTKHSDSLIVEFFRLFREMRKSKIAKKLIEKAKQHIPLDKDQINIIRIEREST